MRSIVCEANFSATVVIGRLVLPILLCMLEVLSSVYESMLLGKYPAVKDVDVAGDKNRLA